MTEGSSSPRVTGPKIAFADIETDGLLDQVTTTLVLCVYTKGRMMAFCDPENYGEDVEESDFDGAISEGLELLDTCDVLVGHNWQGYDAPALQITNGWHSDTLVRDTAVLSRMIWSDLKTRDKAAAAKRPEGWLRKPPKKEGGKGQTMYGNHSLKAWGHRLDEHKGDHDVVGLTCCDMDTLVYCKQDVIVTKKLWDLECARFPLIMEELEAMHEAVV